MVIWLIPKNLRSKVAKHRMLINTANVVLLLFMASVVYCIGFRYLEEGVTWDEAVWQTWQTVTTVGYGNRPAEGMWGRIHTMIIGTLGIALFGVTFGAIFDLIYETRKRRILGMGKNKSKGGYVLVNFPGTHVAERFIAEIRTVEPDISICFVDNEIEQLPNEIQAHHDITFIKGSTIHRDTYERAGVLNSKAVVVFPVSDSDEADGQTSSIVTQICRITKDSETRVLYFLINNNNEELFDGLKATAINDNLYLLAAVQECQDHHTAGIIDRLLSNTVGSNPHTVYISDKIVGWTWGQLVIRLIQSSAECNLLALIPANGQVTACPDVNYQLQVGDRLSVIAYNGFNWKQTEAAL